jgi:hypothetical protein
MLYVWQGFLNEGAEPDQQVQWEVTDFLMQPAIPIRSAGALRDEAGKRAGMLLIFEADDRAAAEALVATSPYLRAGLYREHHLFEYQNEVG